MVEKKTEAWLKVPKFWLTYVFIGIIFLLGAGAFFMQSALQKAENSMRSFNSFMRKQVVVYNQHNYLSLSKDLTNISIMTTQIRYALEGEHGPVTSELLAKYSRDMWLDGIILADAKGNIECGYHGEGVPAGSLISLLNTPTILEISQHPEQIYTDVVDGLGSYRFSVAVCRQTDRPGIIIAYTCQPPDDVKQQNLTIQKLLECYPQEMVGNVVISDGNRIVAAMDADIIGTSVENNSFVQDLLRHSTPGEMAIMDIPGQEWHYGMYDCGRNFYVYNYMPASKVFADVPMNLLFTLIFYVCVISVIQVFRLYSINKLRRAQQLKKAAYQKKLEKSAFKAEAANRTKTEFLQRMSHDIRTPINGILGMIEVGNHYPDDPEKQQDCRNKINEAAKLLLELVNEVLDMGKLESGEIELESRPMDLQQEVRSIVSLVEKQAAKRGITVYKKMDLEHKDVLASPLHIKRLLLNVISNAVKYNKDYGKIYLGCRELGCENGVATVEFVCRDTGIGMSEEFQKRIFKPFTREHEGAGSVGGTGLGMSIAKSLVEKMGGTLEFTSELGHGTTIFVRLPLVVDLEADERAANMAATKEAESEEISLKGLKVLLVEDNALNMEIAEFLLTNEGVSVVQAHNGKEAVAVFTQNPPDTFDAILMDIMMPFMNGYEATKAIRSMEDRPDGATVPIIAMTANAFTDDKRQAYEAGMNEHLAKPLDKELLYKTLGEYCRRQEGKTCAQVEGG